ncbi:MAG: hypothetical protein RIQ43_1623, partial [Pseudomonadota bacterium]
MRFGNKTLLSAALGLALLGTSPYL